MTLAARTHQRFALVVMTLSIAALLAIGTTAIWVLLRPQTVPTVVRDYDDIRADSVLHAVTEYSALGYHIEGDTTVGFHYELISAFATAHGLRLQITPEMSFARRLQGLWSGAYDVIAYGIPITSDLVDTLRFTVPITRTRQVLVQRAAAIDSLHYIRSQLDLANKTLHVEKGSPAILRIRNLSNEIADTIYVDEVEQYGPEQLLAMVAHGDIDYAVVNEAIAHAAIDSFPQLDVATGIGFTQLYAWGVRRSSPALCDTLNVWLDAYMQTPAFRRLYHKYYGK
jgi:membrane-bound lytic murein transglycosylase MltF